jgi:ubiquitin-conjugating enzyme E2 O
VEVTHPDGVTRCYPLQRLTKLYDSISQLEDDIWGDEDAMDVDDDSMDVDDELYEEEMGGASYGWTGQLSGFISSPGISGLDAFNDDEGKTDEELSGDDPEPTEEHTGAADSQLPRDVGHLDWTKFAIVPSAPVDHAYYSTPPGQHPKTFMTRMAKEYRILQSSLPGRCLSFGQSFYLHSTLNQIRLLFALTRIELTSLDVLSWGPRTRLMKMLRLSLIGC